MSIYVSSAFAFAQASAPNADYPVIGYENRATTATLTSTYENALYPATNLCNPATNQIWKSGSTADQYITVLFGAQYDVDYAAVARHNWGSGAVVVTVQGLAFGQDPVSGTWTELVAAQALDGDSPAMFRFVSTPLIGVRLKLEPVTTEPQAAVIYVGALLVFERGVQPGSTPLSFARERNLSSPRSQSGEFLGSVINGGRLASSVTITKLTAAWYRSTLDPFLDATVGLPFFWAWRPQTYPTEVAFAWMPGDSKPSPDMYGYVDVTLQFEGLAL